MRNPQHPQSRRQRGDSTLSVIFGLSMCCGAQPQTLTKKTFHVFPSDLVWVAQSLMDDQIDLPARLGSSLCGGASYGAANPEARQAAQPNDHAHAEEGVFGGSDGENRIVAVPAADDGDLLEGRQLARSTTAGKQTRYAQRSVELLQHARACQQNKKMRSDLAQTKADLSDQRDRLAMAAALLPGVGALLGSSVKKHTSNRSKPRLINFAVFAIAVHIPLKTACKVGMTRKRLICAVAQVLAERQSLGLMTLLRNAQLHVAKNIPRSMVVIGYSHEFDGTRSFFGGIPLWRRRACELQISVFM